jgi:hypothetical protein
MKAGTIFTLLGLVILLLCSGSLLVATQAAGRAVDIAAVELDRPDSGMDLVVRSRTTSPAGSTGRTWLIALFMLACVAGLAGFVLHERARVERIRQQRLAQKQKQQQQRQRLQLPSPTVSAPLRLNGQGERPFGDGGPYVH